MDIDEKKEVVAKNACEYFGKVLESHKGMIVEVSKLMNFLSAIIESAETEEELVNSKVEVKKLFPSFPEFEPGI